MQPTEKQKQSDYSQNAVQPQQGQYLMPSEMCANYKSQQIQRYKGQ